MIHDALGQVIRVADGNGSTDYVDDGTDANGQAESRGQVTKVTQTVDTAGGASVASRYLALTGDGLGLAVTTAGGEMKATLDLAGPRGDVAATSTLIGTELATGIGQWGEYTEYGTAVGATQGGIGYGWLGQHERATLGLLGMTLMGARLYNQTTGLFTSLDPQYQGGDTAYGYPNDPVDTQDLNGISWWRRAKRYARAAGNWTYDHRGGIATAAAAAFCLAPAI